MGRSFIFLNNVVWTTLFSKGNQLWNQNLLTILNSITTTTSVEGLNGCAVGVHDRQDNGVGRASVRAKAVAKAETITQK